MNILSHLITQVQMFLWGLCLGVELLSYRIYLKQNSWWYPQTQPPLYLPISVSNILITSSFDSPVLPVPYIQLIAMLGKFLPSHVIIHLSCSLILPFTPYF